MSNYDMIDNKLICGDSLKILKEMKEATIDLIYMDPPFFTQDIQRLVSKQKKLNFPSQISGIVWMII